MFRSYKFPTTEAGFTLIELLVVVVVLAILTGVAMMSLDLSGDQRALQAYGQRMVQRIELARDRAIQNNQEWGIKVTADDYMFLAFDERERRWLPQQQAPFRPDTPPAPIEFRLTVEDGSGAVLNQGTFASADPYSAGSLAGKKSRAAQPDAVFFSSGEALPFRLDILRQQAATSQANSIRLSTDGFRPLSLEIIDPLGAVVQ